MDDFKYLIKPRELFTVKPGLQFIIINAGGDAYSKLKWKNKIGIFRTNISYSFKLKNVIIPVFTKHYY